MTGKLLIDGIDVWTAYRAYVEKNGWNGLLSFPSLKQPDTNDWHEYDGLEVDLDNPVLDTRELTLSLASETIEGYRSVVSLMGQEKSVHTLTCLGRTFKLRMTHVPSLTISRGMSKFNLRLQDDSPLITSYVAPVADYQTFGDNYILGGLGTSQNPVSRSLAAYGISVLGGSQAEVEKSPSVKPNLTVNIASQSGAQYDDAPVVYQARDVRLNCLMRTNTLAGMWRNLDALLYDLVRPNARTLNGFECYYKSMSVSEFYPDGAPWLRFALTLCFFGGGKIMAHKMRFLSDRSIRKTNRNSMYFCS